MLQSFLPVVSPKSKFIIIGSMPGAASLAAQEYYAYKHNAFWPIIFDVFAPGKTPINYEDKLRTLLSNGGALWDTLASCHRTGSLDANIHSGHPNDFVTLFNQYPALQTLLFNGQTAHKLFVRHFGHIPGKNYILLPSTSPANAACPYAAKLALWKEALRKAAGR